MNRRSLLSNLVKAAGKENVISVRVPWRRSLDVPRFLKKLDRFEKQSRKSKLFFRCYERNNQGSR